MNLCGNANRIPQVGQLSTSSSSVIVRMLIAFYPAPISLEWLLNIGAFSHSEFPSCLIQRVIQIWKHCQVNPDFLCSWRIDL